MASSITEGALHDRMSLTWYARRAVARRLLALAVPALLQAAMALAQPGAGGAHVLAPGEPQLTQQMVGRVTTLLGDTVGQPLNARQRDRMHALYVGYWRARNRDEMQAMLDLLDLATVLDALPKAQRAETLQGFREEFLPHLRDAAKTDADARWLYALHEQSLRGAHAAGPLRVSPDTAPPPLLPPEKKPATVGAATPSSTPAVGPVTRSHVAAPAAGVTYMPPAGWTRQDDADAVVFDALLKPEPRASHSARISVFRPVAAPGGIAAQFDSEWRRIVVPTAGAKAGEAVAYYRNRLPGGIDAYFMGRFFDLPTQTQQLYVVMYVLDLGDRAQTVVATVVGAWDGVGYPGAVDDSAYQALAQALFPLLDSIQVPGRRAGGPLFGASEVRGRWLYQNGSYGGSFVSHHRCVDGCGGARRQ